MTNASIVSFPAWRLAGRLAAAFLLSLAPLTAAPAWSQFRGPNGSGVADTARTPVEFGPARGVLWQTPLPPGSSSPCLWGDRVFLTALSDGKLETICLSRRGGEVLWRRAWSPKKLEDYHKTEGSPAASTPAADGRRVVVYFGSGALLAYDMDGNELWRADLPVAETNNGFGSGTSPILADDLVLLVRDLAKDSALLAFDARTGKKVWRVERPGFATGWGSPIIWDQGGVKQLVVPGGLRLKAYDLKSGHELWAMRDMPALVCTTPVVGDSMLYFAGWSPSNSEMPKFDDLLAQGDDDKDGALSRAEAQKTFLRDFFDSNDLNKDGRLTRDEWETQMTYLARGQNVLVAVRPGGSGDITDTHVAWKKTKGLPYVASPLLYRGRVYIVKDGGLASCFDARTGTAFFEQGRLGVSGSFYASPVGAGGHVYMASLNGTIAVLKADDRLEVEARNDLGERIAATPAVADNTLYVRTASRLFAFGDVK
jgi:outer membrane protein assembly factor BamB